MDTGTCVYVYDPQELYNDGESNPSGVWKVPQYCNATTYPGKNAEGELRTDPAPYCPEHGGPSEPEESAKGPAQPVTQDDKDVEIARLKAQLADSKKTQGNNTPEARQTTGDKREAKK
jgi:hypothetical protein